MFHQLVQCRNIGLGESDDSKIRRLTNWWNFGNDEKIMFERIFRMQYKPGMCFVDSIHMSSRSQSYNYRCRSIGNADQIGGGDLCRFLKKLQIIACQCVLARC